MKYTCKFIGILLLVHSSICSAEASALELSGINVLDPANGEETHSVSVRIAGDRIISVGRDDGGAAEKAMRMDGHWVIPGLVDMHTHLEMAGKPSSLPNMSTSTRALLAYVNARAMLRQGFTTVRNLGGQNFAVTDLARAIDSGLLTGPTIVDAGKTIIPFGPGASVSEGRFSHPIPAELGDIWEHVYIVANNPWEMREAVRQTLYYGASTVKIVTDQNRYFFSIEELSAAINEAHRAGVTVAIHTGGGEAARNAILSGADTIEHGFDLTREHLELMREQGVSLGTTDFSPELLLHIFDGDADAARPWGEKIARRLSMAHEVGVELVFGSDAIFDLPGRDRGEMAIGFIDTWAGAGIPNLDTLRAMTVNAYRILGMDEDQGRVDKGFMADLVVVRDNPVDDIGTLREPVLVIKRGKVVYSAEADTEVSPP